MSDNEIIELANRFTKDRGDPNNYLCLYEDGELQQFARAVAAKEREACAKICDARAEADTWEGGYAHQCANEIRARS